MRANKSWMLSPGLCPVAFILAILVVPGEAIAGKRTMSLEEQVEALAKENAELKAEIQALKMEIEKLKKPAHLMRPEAYNEPPATAPPIDRESRRNYYFFSEYQFDSRGFNVIHFRGSSDLPLGLTTWGFIDFEGLARGRSGRADEAGFFIEWDLRRKVWRDLGFELEYTDSTGTGNDILRFALTYPLPLGRIDKNLSVTAKLFFLETDGKGGQVGVSWQKRFPSLWGRKFFSRISMGGFFDINLSAGANSSTFIVSDSELAFHLMKKISFTAEYRYNEFRRPGERGGLALGVRYNY